MKSKSSCPDMIWKRIRIQNKHKVPPKKVSSLPTNMKQVEELPQNVFTKTNEDDFIKQLQKEGILVQVEDSDELPQGEEMETSEVMNMGKNGKMDEAYYENDSNDMQSFSIVDKLNFQDSNKNSVNREQLSDKFMTKIKLRDILSYLAQLRHEISSINKQIAYKKEQMTNFKHQNNEYLAKIMTQFSQIKPSQDTEKLELLQDIIKIKQERIQILNNQLQKMKAQNLQLTQKIFYLNQDLVQNELIIQKKVSQIIEKGYKKIEDRPQSNGEMFDSIHIDEKEKLDQVVEGNDDQSKIQMEIQAFKTKFNELVENNEEAYYQPTPDTYLNSRKQPPKFNISLQNTYSNITHERAIPYNSYSYVPRANKSMTPTNKPEITYNELLKNKSQPYPYFNSTNNTINTIAQGRGYKANRYAGTFGVNSPKNKPNFVVSRGFDRTNDDYVIKLLNRDDAPSYEASRHPITTTNGALDRIKNRTIANRAPNNEQKLNKIGQRIDLLRSQIKKQIGANK